jgi:hypothetical protein
MEDNRERTAELRKGGQPVAAGLPSDASIRRKTASDAVQHPATLVPLAACGISTVYLLLLSPILGGGAIVIAAASGTAATVSYISRYKKEYPRNAREMIRILDEERARLEQAELTQWRQDIQAGFFSVGSSTGLKTLTELNSSYEQLEPALCHGRSTDPLSVSLIPALAGETYRRGLSVLSEALELMNVIQTPGKENLEGEIAQMEMDFETSTVDETRTEQLLVREDTLALRRERLDRLNKLQLYVDRLLYQAQRCEASLHGTRIEIAAVRAGSSKTGVDMVVETLQRTIHQVKEVQDELERMGL